MSKRQIFEFDDYKTYLKERISTLPHQGRGMGRRLARAAGCNGAYVSQVLNGAAHFSLEQAQAVSELLEHSEEESGYFLDLLCLNRAGTQRLKGVYARRIEAARERRGELRNRLDYERTFAPEDQQIFYSSWQYAAVHLLLTIPKFRTREALLSKTGLSPRRLEEILEFLVSRGLARKTRQGWEAGATRTHLGSDQALISRHHINWRMKAIAAMERGMPTAESGLHYSGAISIARKDVPRVRAALVEAIERARRIIKESPEEEVYCYSVDLFEVF